MKKSIIFFSFLLSFVFAITMFSNVGNVEKASAKSLSVAPQSIIIVGSGEVEVMPDTVQINFGLKSRADDLLTGQTKMKENIDSITKKIQEVDKDAVVNISFSSSYPINHGGIFGYEIDCCLTAKSSKVENVTELTDAIISSNITSVHNTNYTLTNKEEAYIQALVKAKENADSKAKAMFNSASFKGLKEESYYNFCESSKGDKIKVCAKVRAFYEIGNSEDTNTSNTDNTTNTTNAFEVSQNKTPVISNQTNKEIKNENTSLPTTQTQNKQLSTLQNEEVKESNSNQNNTTETSVLMGENNKTEDKKTDSNLQKENQTEDIKNEGNLVNKNQEESANKSQEKSVETLIQNEEQKTHEIVNAPKGSIIDANGNVTKIDEINENNSENNDIKNSQNLNQEEIKNNDLSNKKSA